MFLLGNLSNVDLGQGTPGNKDLILQMEGMLLPILGILWIVLLALVILTTKRTKGKGSKNVGGGGRNGFLISLLVIATVLVIAVALGGSNTVSQGNDPGSGDSGGSGASPDQGGTSPTLSTAAFPAAALVLVIIVIIAAVLVMRRGMTPTPVAVDLPAGTPEPEASLAVSAAIAELESHPDARSGILAAYGRMADQLGRPGEDRTLTPREFAAKSGWRLKESASSLKELTALFEEARYSDHAMGEAERNKALAALKDIETELGRKAG
jgi:hypothetical protein